jgi:hypothetical protein
MNEPEAKSRESKGSQDGSIENTRDPVRSLDDIALDVSAPARH